MLAVSLCICSLGPWQTIAGMPNMCTYCMLHLGLINVQLTLIQLLHGLLMDLHSCPEVLFVLAGSHVGGVMLSLLNVCAANVPSSKQELL